MTTALGLIGIAFFIAGVVSLAAGVTYLTVRLSPNPNNKKKPKPEASAS
ncbi:MAG: hypothetical protein F2663_04550 [Actinobacteria bacterium]|uniref:Unannotated protein n=1 Tax=freshwater metagenome TaxID=449393 RepID=A0A6J6P697_9ZZZZ|nr:hypothetical protein [Actinomycetota bacterium]